MGNSDLSLENPHGKFQTSQALLSSQLDDEAAGSERPLDAKHRENHRGIPWEIGGFITEMHWGLVNIPHSLEIIEIVGNSRDKTNWGLVDIPHLYIL